MISIGDDYVIENDRGERVYRLDGKALRVRKTILFEDADGHELYKIQERMLHIRDSMEIEDPGGHRAKAELICVSRATASTTSTRSNETGTMSPRSPNDGSACGTPTGSRCSRVRTIS
jgi:hypothetical protein